MGGTQEYFRALSHLLPECILVVGILFACLWNLMAPKYKSITPLVSLGSLVRRRRCALLSRINVSEKLFGGVFTVDPLFSLISLVSVAVGIIVVLMSMGYDQHFGKNRGEYYSILLTAVLANVFLAGSTDLIMLFVSLETLSICCVLLAGFIKRDLKSGEASLKYLLSTAATTATLLYALSFLYGLSGSTSFEAIRDVLSASSSGSSSFFHFLILALTLSAIGFKLSIVPFHMWTPDVYEGAPLPVTAFLSIGSKAGGFVVAIRLLTTVFASSQIEWAPMLAVLAILSMIAGNLIALAQSSFKRMLAYSSIAHVGYILIGLIATTTSGLSAMMYYIMSYGSDESRRLCRSHSLQQRNRFRPHRRLRRPDSQASPRRHRHVAVLAQPGRIANSACRIFRQGLHLLRRRSNHPTSSGHAYGLGPGCSGSDNVRTGHLLLHPRRHPDDSARALRKSGSALLGQPAAS